MTDDLTMHMETASPEVQTKQDGTAHAGGVGKESAVLY